MATIVVVDDEALNTDALTFLLVAEGMTVRTASDGAEALSLITECLPDLVITDFMMPIMTGLDLAQVLKAHIITSHIPIILLTAAQTDIGRQHENLFDMVFQKPCPPPDILRAIFKLINKDITTSYFRI